MADPKNRLVIGVAVSYLTLILIFSIVYYTIYKCDRKSFGFSDGIATAQLRSVANRESNRLAKLTEELRVLREALSLAEDPRSRFTTRFGGGAYAELRTQGGTIYELTCNVESSDPSDPNEVVVELLKGFSSTRLTVMGSGKTAYTILSRENCSIPATLEELKVLWKNWTSAVLRERASTLGVINSLKLPDEPVNQERQPARVTADVWSFWDFLYFSTITQATVGYGDILPNSTGVRIGITVHSILSVLLISIAVNLSISRNLPRLGTEEPELQLVRDGLVRERAAAEAARLDAALLRRAFEEQQSLTTQQSAELGALRGALRNAQDRCSTAEQILATETATRVMVEERQRELLGREQVAARELEQVRARMDQVLERERDSLTIAAQRVDELWAELERCQSELHAEKQARANAVEGATLQSPFDMAKKE